MRSVIVIGAGGHASVCLDILSAHADLEVLGCVGMSRPGPLTHRVIGGDEILPELYRQGIGHAFVAVGDNSRRALLMQMATDLGFELVNAVSSAAWISPTVSLPRNVAVMPGAVINAHARIGSGTIINTGATVDHDCRIGASAHIAPGSHLAGNVTIGEGAFVGIGAQIIPGCSVGAWSTVGAGAVVVRNVPPGVTVVGVPATLLLTGDADAV